MAVDACNISSCEQHAIFVPVLLEMQIVLLKQVAGMHHNIIIMV